MAICKIVHRDEYSIQDRDAYVETVADDIRDAKAIDVHKALKDFRSTERQLQIPQARQTAIANAAWRRWSSAKPVRAGKDLAKKVCPTRSGLLHDGGSDQTEVQRQLFLRGADFTTTDHS